MDPSPQKENSFPLTSPTSDSALGTLSDFTPEEELPNTKNSENNLEEMSDSDLVVSASMQFTLTPSPNASDCNGEPSLEQEAPRASPIPGGGVPIQVKHHKEQVRQASEEPSGTEGDVEDNSLDDVSTTSSNRPSPHPPPQLPETVSYLSTEEGSHVYVVGTAHFSKESQDDVSKTIRLVRPDVVLVELCKSRTAVLQLDEETILNESQSLDFAKVRMVLRQHGQVQGVLYLLLLSVSAHITKQLGMAPGGEFRTAISEVRRSVPGCQIRLGDRPIQITLSRALASLSVWQKMKLMWHILTSNEPISKEEVEKCKKKDFIEEMLAEMTGQFPAISEVFVKERDIYLTKSLQTAATPIKTCFETYPRVVVGVVGIGHVPGIVERWGKVTDADIPPIMSIPPASLSNQVFKYTLKFTIYGAIGFGIYKCLPSSAKSSMFSRIDSSITSVSKYLTK